MCLLRGTDWIFECNSDRFSCVGRAIAQAVGCRPVTAEARFRFQDSPMSDCDGPCGTATCFSPSTAVSPVSIISPVLFTRVQEHVAFTRRANGRSLETVQKGFSFRIMQLWLEKYFPFFRA